MKPRNGPISPRDHRERDYHQSSSSHFSYNNSMNNHYHSNHNSHHHSPQQQQQQQPPPPPSSQHNFNPNSDLINFVSSAWKEKVNYIGIFNHIMHTCYHYFFKVSSDKTEYFKSTESPEKYREFDFDSWVNANKTKTMRNSS